MCGGGELIPVCGSPPLPRLDRWGPGRARGRCPGSKVCSLKISPTENDNEMRGLTSERGRAGGRNGRRSLGGGTEAPDRLKLEGRWREDVLTVFVKVSRETFRHQFKRNAEADVGEAPLRHRNPNVQVVIIKTKEEELLSGTFQMSLRAVPLTGVGGCNKGMGWYLHVSCH